MKVTSDRIVRIEQTAPIKGVPEVKVRDCFRGLEASLEYISREQICPKTMGGKVTAYVAESYFSPSNLLASVTGYTREEGFRCGDYAELLLASEVMFSPKQVSDILHNHEKWKGVLELTGKTNIFPIWVGRERHIILARFSGGEWHIKDSIFGRGRGTNPGVHLLLRNEYIKLEV